MTIASILATKGNKVVTIRPEQSIRDALRVLAEHNIGALVAVDPGLRPVGILSEDGNRVTALRCEKTDGSMELFEIPCDMVIKAVGQTKRKTFFEKVIDVEVDDRGRVIVDKKMETSEPNVFAGGDCVNGGGEAVEAAQMGKLAAQGIHKALSGESVEFAGAKVTTVNVGNRPAH